jgi:hypothetical protein
VQQCTLGAQKKMFYDSKMFKYVSLSFAFSAVLTGRATPAPVGPRPQAGQRRRRVCALPLPGLRGYHELDGCTPFPGALVCAVSPSLPGRCIVN